MEYFSWILTVSSIHFLALISPGPDFVVVVRNSFIFSSSIGVWTALGFAVGISFHICYCIFGLALIFSESSHLFNLIKYMGVGYLIYIGIGSFKSNKTSIIIDGKKNKYMISPFEAIKIGFLTNILNPKVTLFFLSLFTLIIIPQKAPYSVLFILCMILIFSTFLWFSLVAIFLTQKKIQNYYIKFQKLINRVLGITLIFLAISILIKN